MRWIAIATLLVAAQTQSATTVRTWTDADGVTHFSDRPETQDAAFLEIADPNIIDPFKAIEHEREAVKPRRRTSSARSQNHDRGNDRAADRRAERCLRATLGLRAVQNQRRRGYRPSQDRALRDRRTRYQAEQRFYCD